MVDINLKCSGYKFCHLENSLAGSWYVFFFVFLVNASYTMWIYSCRFYSHCLIPWQWYFYIVLYCGILLLSSLSQESCFGTVEKNEHNKEILLLIKDMNDYHFKRSNKMSSLLLHLINCYINYVNYLSKLLNVLPYYNLIQSKI